MARAQLNPNVEPPVGISTDLIPVFIALRDVSPVIRVDGFEKKSLDEQKKILLAAFHNQVEEELSRLKVPEFKNGLLDAIRCGKILLVLDGLDEVPYDLRPRIRQFVGAIIEAKAPERMIITCRIRSYSGSTEIPDFDRFTLAPFDREKIVEFVQAWYNAFKADYTTEQFEFRKDDLTRAAQEEDLREMASNPMLLTVMAIIHQEDVQLPPQKVKLYKRAVEILLRRWQKQKTGDFSVTERLDQFLRDDQRLYPAMERLAFMAHKARRFEKGKKQDAPELLRTDAITILESNECNTEDHYPLAQEFMDYVDQKAGLLIGNGEAIGIPASYSFPHRTFQEYLAGCHLASQRHFFREIRPLAAEGDQWDVVIQMAIEELYHNSRGGTYTLLEASYSLCKPCSDVDEAGQRLMLWAGMIAALISRKEYETDQDKPEDAKEFMEQITPGLIQVMQRGLPPVERADAGHVLARLGDPRPEVMTVDGMRFCFVPAGEFYYRDRERIDKRNLPAFWLAEFPVSQAQFLEFVNDHSYQDKRWWLEAVDVKFWSKEGFKGGYDDEFRTTPYDYQEPFGLLNHPVVGVTWYEAMAFTHWLSARWQAKSWLPAPWQVSLPRNSSGKRAARGGLEIPAGTDALPMRLEKIRANLISSIPVQANPSAHREYPWQGEFEANRANTSESGIGATSALGCFPLGVSPYGLQELSGTVWEWQENWYDEDKKYKELRGGSWFSIQYDARVSTRDGTHPSIRNYVIGFRCVLSPGS
jgi:formylglycine-generating enzyme required for sulfatase activity